MSRYNVKREVYFEDIYQKISALLHSAKSSVKICVAWITAERLSRTIAQLYNDGVAIEIVYDDNPRNHQLRGFDDEMAALYPVRTRTRGFMHNKFCIIDDEILVTGSFNWTYNADNSFENALVIEGDYRLIKSYLHEFEDLKNYSQLWSLNYIKINHFHKDGSPCRSICYDIGIFGYLEGATASQRISIWNVCSAHKIGTHVRTLVVDDEGDDEENLLDQLDDEWHLTREGMLRQLKLERQIRDAPRGFFSRELGLGIQAYGTVKEKNEGFSTEYGINEFVLEMDWRDMYWRKIIPQRFYEEDGTMHRIIELHKPGRASRW